MSQEFEIIKKYFAAASNHNDESSPYYGIGDDCALLAPRQGFEFAMSLDSYVAGIHFPQRFVASQLAERVIAASLSDLAAMGAVPRAIFLGLTLPAASEIWLASFSQGLRSALSYYQCSLLGGDTTRGPLAVSVQVVGEVELGQALRRDGACCGDDVYVSGLLGDACAALKIIRHAPSTDTEAYLHQRFWLPRARINLGRALLGVASSAIDISDGLVGDLKHIVEKSGVRIRLDASMVRYSQASEGILGADGALRAALTGGDDYELCFTASTDKRDQVAQIASQLDLEIYRVGSVIEGDPDLKLLDVNDPDSYNKAYQHF